MKNTILKSNKGITLVALVITIIVLIILAAVSINAVMNEGLIENAKTAASDYKEKAQIEAIQLALTAEEVRTSITGTSKDMNKIKEELEKAYGEGKVTIEELKGTSGGTTYTLENEFILKIEDKAYRIYEDSRVTKWEYNGNITFDFDGTTCTIFNGATWDDVCKLGMKMGEYYVHYCPEPGYYQGEYFYFPTKTSNMCDYLDTWSDCRSIRYLYR